MKPVEQTITEGPEADCLRACIASILEMQIERVPNYHTNWLKLYNDWLLPTGLTLVWFDEGAGHPIRPRGFSILSAKSPRGDFDHCVVCRDGDIVWDPHPQREMGVGRYVDWIVFAVREPQMMRLDEPEGGV